jgi:hypothetical protein
MLVAQHEGLAYEHERLFRLMNPLTTKMMDDTHDSTISAVALSSNAFVVLLALSA